MLKLYGKKQSRAARCLWLLEELGLAYTHVPIDTQNGETQTAEYLALNPSGKVPLLDDDGFVLRESIAINAYLVTKAQTLLWPAAVKAQAEINQWSSWATTDMECPLTAIFYERRRTGTSGGQVDPGFLANNLKMAGNALKVLDDHLAATPFVMGEDFTLGDLNAYTTVMLAPMFLELSGYPAVQKWMAVCGARPAWKRVAALP